MRHHGLASFTSCYAVILANTVAYFILGYAILVSLPILWTPPLLQAAEIESSQGDKVRGPEAKDLSKYLRGYLLFEEPGVGITALHSWPNEKRTVVFRDLQKSDVDRATIAAISGPDSSNRIAFMEDHFFVSDRSDRRHLLKLVEIDGANLTTLFSRKGSVSYNAGRFISLSPVGGKVVTLTGQQGVQMPSAFLELSQIEIWDIVKRQRQVVDTLALDESPCWYSDGRRFLYAKLVERNDLPTNIEGMHHFGKYYDQVWDRLPVVFEFDLETNKSSLLCVGWKGRVSLDGKTIVICGIGRNGRQWFKLTSEGRFGDELILPGLAGDIVAILDQGLFIYWGLPTEGTEIRFTENNSPLRGAKRMLTIKVAKASTGEYQTIVPYVDARWSVCYGTGESGGDKR